MPLRSIRRATAKQMTLAWSQIPHVTHQDVADITELEKFRRQHQEAIEKHSGKLSLTVLVMQAVVAALKQFPRFNASLDPEAGEIILKRYYHLGVAVDEEVNLWQHTTFSNLLTQRLRMSSRRFLSQPLRTSNTRSVTPAGSFGSGVPPRSPSGLR